MTAPLLATRDALAAHEPALGTFAGRPGIVGCSCLSARDYRAAGFRGGQAGWRDHLLASGVVRDPATLADDEALMFRMGAIQVDLDPTATIGPKLHRTIMQQAAQDTRALAAALTEDPS